MTILVDTVTLTLLVLGILTAIPAGFLVLQVGAAFFPAKRPASFGFARCPRFTVVMPAHDEEAVIARTVASLMAQMPSSGRLLVVADNCSDDTARIAASAGAEVTVRRDATRKGKGYALDHGIRSLASDPPQVVIVLDADCEVTPGTLGILATRCVATGCPVQARDVMLAPSSPSSSDKVSLLAWTVKTFVRPMGSMRLGWPCPLMGTGMALPYELIAKLDLATGHLTEDQRISAELALARKSPQFCPDAQVVSQFPESETGKRQQRTRWEHGHLAVIGEFFLPMLRQALAKRSLRLFAFTLDLCIPPLTLLAVALMLTEIVCLAWWAASGAAGPLLLSSGALACFVGSIGAAWWRFGQDIISWRELASGPAYCLFKLPSYVRFFIHRRIEWVRTER